MILLARQKRIEIKERLREGEAVEGYCLCSACQGSGSEGYSFNSCMKCCGVGFLEVLSASIVYTE